MVCKIYRRADRNEESLPEKLGEVGWGMLAGGSEADFQNVTLFTQAYLQTKNFTPDKITIKLKFHVHFSK